MLNSQNVGAMYDAWLQAQADEYYGGGCGGDPQIIGIDSAEIEGYDEDGRPEISYSYTYSCTECDNTECSNWKDFHEDEWAKMQAEQEGEDE